MPLTPKEIETLQATQSRYGCGRDTCLACYPIIYGCENCGQDYPEPIANGETYTCEECEWSTGDNLR